MRELLTNPSAVPVYGLFIFGVLAIWGGYILARALHDLRRPIMERRFDAAIITLNAYVMHGAGEWDSSEGSGRSQEVRGEAMWLALDVLEAVRDGRINVQA